MAPQAILDQLRDQAGVVLNELPSSSGIYALRDHLGTIRYIGIAHTEGFRTRISNKHTSGSEDRSHKFSAAYNSGRMWRDRHAGHGPDAKVSKRLRIAFIRKHCTASYVPIENYGSKSELEAIEVAVQQLAEPDEIAWCRTFQCVTEPEHLVDSLMNELRFSDNDRNAVMRQSSRSKEIK